MTRSKNATTVVQNPKENMYYEDFEVGAQFISPSRVIARSDIRQFADVTGDHHPLHTDDEYCKATPFGGIIAHGLFGVALMEGLKNQLRIYDKTGIASLGWDRIRFLRPLFPNDAVHLKITFINKRETRKPDRGILWEKIELINQNNEVLTEAKHTSMIMRRRQT